MKYLIFGKDSGWLAKKFNNFLEDSLISEVDITDLPAIRRELEEVSPEVVINAAGITGRPNIDWCEEHKLETVAGNVSGALNIEFACAERNIYWAHLSSGCVFQGSGPYNKGFMEDDKSAPPSFYSYTKHWTDEILKNFPVLIIRLRLPIDNEPGPRNLIDKLVKYPRIIDSENSVTVIPDLMFAMKKLIEKRKTGVYHVVNPGTIRPSEIMMLYKEMIDPSHQFEIISGDDLYKMGLAKATRSNCVLNTGKLEEEGIILAPIQERIKEVLLEYKKHLNKQKENTVIAL
jgi:dTDP-4-dehydrorhamnose reductase